MEDQTDSEGKPNLRLAYQRAGESYEAITEFRGKLLTLLPLATGTGAFLLLERAQKDPASSQFRNILGPIGIFSAVVTLGLFAYELRGMQRCHRLETQASVLESDLGLSMDQAQFLGQPRRALCNMLGPPAAGLIVYLATFITWLWLAGYGFHRWELSSPWSLSVFLVGYVVLLILAWVGLSRWLERSATDPLSAGWKRYVIEMPPMDRTWASELGAARDTVKHIAMKPELTAQLDRAEVDYLASLHKTLLDKRIEAAARNRQQGKRCLMRH
jgi:hypothetical protein